MTTGRQKVALFVASAIAVASGTACSFGGSSRSDSTDPSREDETTEPSLADEKNEIALSIACGGPDLLDTATYLDEDGFPVTPNAVLAVAFNADGEKRLTSNGSGLLLTTAAVIPGGSTVDEVSVELPSGNSKVGLVVDRDQPKGPDEIPISDITIIESDDTLTGYIATRGSDLPEAASYGDRPLTTPDFGATVTVILGSGSDHRLLNGNLANGKAVGEGQPYLNAIHITSEMENGDPASPDEPDVPIEPSRTDAIDRDSAPGTVLAMTVANAPDPTHSNAPDVKCTMVTIKSLALGK